MKFIHSVITGKKSKYTGIGTNGKFSIIMLNSALSEIIENKIK